MSTRSYTQPSLEHGAHVNILGLRLALHVGQHKESISCRCIRVPLSGKLKGALVHSV